MLNPWDYLTDSIKNRLIDAGLTKVADAAEATGSSKLAQNLRKLRSDTPFIEDVAAGLRRAVDSFAVSWRVRDPEFVAAVENADLWLKSDFLADLAATLFRPMTVHGPEFDRMKASLNAASPDIPDDRLTEGLEYLLAKVREELFEHPKLLPIHALYLQVSSLEGQAAILQELRAIHKDNTAVLGSIASQQRRETVTLPAAGPQSAKEQSGRDTASIRARGGRPALGGRLPDVLTPPLANGTLLVTAYEPVVGREAAVWLDRIQAGITASIERADFAEQEEIAKQLLASDLKVGGIEASGYYMLAEAQRLQADFAGSQLVRERFLDSAMDSYSTALDVDPDSARAMRGLGRVHEVRGDVGKALNLYGKARITALHALEDDSDLISSDAAHEVLRSTRHYASCMAQRIRDDRQGLSARDSSLRQLHGVVLESDDLHRSILPKFAAQEGWMYIEWFMGLVLLAKAYIAVEDFQRAWTSLVHALSARMTMMDPTRTYFSSVEQGNLMWWCSIAKGVKIPLANFERGVEYLANSVARGEAVDAWLSMNDLVRPVMPPWIRQSERAVS
jgi:hypothetical protein